MSAHVLFNLLNVLGKEIKCEACRAFYHFFAMSLINSIIQEHESNVSFITRHYKYSNIAFGVKTSRFRHLLCDVIVDIIVKF